MVPFVKSKKILEALNQERIERKIRKIRKELYYYGDIELIRYTIFELQRLQEDVESILLDLRIMDGISPSNSSSNNFSGFGARDYFTK